MMDTATLFLPDLVSFSLESSILLSKGMWRGIEGGVSLFSAGKHY